MRLQGNETYLRQSPPRSAEEPTELAPFIIAIDTREQRPFEFRGIGKRIYTNRQTLKTGDYSLVGFEKRVCVERKSKLDLYQSVTHERDRFERELKRMSQMERACVVVECSVEEVQMGTEISRVSPENIVLTALSWAGRYRVPWFFMADRAEAERATFDFLRFAWRDFTAPKHHKEDDSCQTYSSNRSEETTTND
ncbi:MAG: ERCC4 domain-containing protein [Thermoguttaceae bacterium]